MRYVLTVSYDGTRFSGWQRQKNALSVQEVMEDALREAIGGDHVVTASGRTDAGVHAAGQVCHFDAEGLTIPPEKMPDLLNRFLPHDIRVLKGQTCAAGFDCCRSAKRKTYRYSLYASARELPLKERYAVRVEQAPPPCELKKAAKLFEGEHDFKAFCASGSAVKTTVRTVYEVKVEEGESLGSRDIDIYVTGNGFLYNMVRTMVGELLDLSAGRRSTDSLDKAFQTGSRELLGKTMPAKGLTLIQVEYGEDMLV
jgi:tRNA pseudouridine38-40 synthase